MDGDGRMMVLQRELFGHAIWCQAEQLDSGLHVLVTGGCRTHIGAVSVAEPGKDTKTMTFPGHKDQFVSEPWAKALAEKTGARVCVVCGIHYDDATKEQIAEILRITDGLLAELLDRVERR